MMQQWATKHRIAGLTGAALIALTWSVGGLVADGLPPVRPKRAGVTDADRSFWSFQPLRQAKPPAVEDGGWSRTEIDRFIFASLFQSGLSPSPEADRITLIRRATFDLHGLPPTPAEVDVFVVDPSPDAYEKLIDRLLASPRYGERWARHWLDLVRYAESDGFKQDTFRPAAWPYRDYVIRSFNDDKRYDQFVTEQLAGDELAPEDPEVIVATGYLRHTPYEYNQRDVPKQWSDMLNDVTDVTGDLFLGLSVGCARCHNHKFDPITQADYYRLQAFFTPMLPRDVFMATPQRQAEVAAATEAWEKKSASARTELAKVEAPFIRKSQADAIAKFPAEMQAVIAMPAGKRSPLEVQWAALAYRQVSDPEENPPVKISDKQLKAKHTELKKAFAVFEADRPTPLQKAQAVCDVGPTSPPTFIPGHPEQPLDPSRPSVLDGGPLQAPVVKPTAHSTGRRSALAAWITDPSNALAARVIVNRIWQYHFGRGIVTTSSDFGTLGERPSHPELLDWLASHFIAPAAPEGAGAGWRFKAMHRLIMTSATYRQASLVPTSGESRRIDPDNRLLSRMTTRRLDSGQVRDAMLAVSGELLDDAGGAGVDPGTPRRSVYTKVIRNKRDPLLDAFDEPESFCSVAERNSTTTATQSLLMINGEWPLQRAKGFAARVRREAKSSDPASLVDAAYSLAFSRLPLPDERTNAVTLLNAQGEKPAAESDGLIDLCHVLLNANEFLYVD